MNQSDTPRPKTPHSLMIKYMFLAFPLGIAQMEAEFDQFHALLPKLTRDETGRLLVLIKVQKITAPDSSTEDQMLPMIQMIQKLTNGKLTNEEAHEAYNLITGGSGPTVTGGDGLSAGSAIVINNANSTGAGIAMEHAHLNRMFGKRGEDYTIEMQRPEFLPDGVYDVFTVTLLKDGTIRDCWVNITQFYGRF